MDNKPLISVIVLTYNSSKYILETLESIKLQSYKNIELIISDDGSQDHTVQLCEKWIQNNDKYFIHCEVLTVSKNTGIPANCNRGVNISSGSWIKLLGGDDLLINDSLENNLRHAQNTNSQVVVSDMIYFDENNIYPHQNKFLDHFFSKKILSEKKRTFARVGLYFNSPTFFISKMVVDINDGFDESFVLLEDKPFIMKCLLNELDISYLKTITVKYRRNINSVTARRNLLLEKDIMNYNEKYSFPILRTGNIIDRFFLHINRKIDFYNRKNIGKYSVIQKVYNKIFDFLKLKA